MRAVWIALALVMTAPLASAEDERAGRYELTYRSGMAKQTVELTLESLGGGEYAVTRVVDLGREVLRLEGHGVLAENGIVAVTYGAQQGASGRLRNLGSDTLVTDPYTSKVAFLSSGWVACTSVVPTGRGDRERVLESGRRTSDVAGGEQDGATQADEELEADTAPVSQDDGAAVSILTPFDRSVAVVGQTAPLSVRPPGARVRSRGPANREADSVLFTAPGEVQLQAKKDSESSRVIKVTVVQPRIGTVTVLDAIPISDAPPPHYMSEREQQEPAALLMGAQVTLALTLDTEPRVTVATPVKVEALLRGRVVGSVEADPSNAQRIKVETLLRMPSSVKINTLEIAWRVAGQDIGTSSLRIYSLFAAPLPSRRTKLNESVTKVHLEKACGWANGASQLSAQGSDSIPYVLNDAMRHYVHWDQLGSDVPPVPDYPPGTPRPLNYHLLSGIVTGGRRAPAHVYYPPIEPRQELEEYHHYRNNFGWRVLDNPSTPGGRCNQQAELLVDVLATVGVEADVYYIQRSGRGRRSGRPMRQYFHATDGTGPWNFHAITRVRLADGSYWLYDHSFSPRPGRRLNGSQQQVDSPGGPFIKRWTECWTYDDRWARVPVEDWPESWSGVQLTEAERAERDRAREAQREEERKRELAELRQRRNQQAYSQALALYQQGKGKSWWNDDDEAKFRQALNLLGALSTPIDASLYYKVRELQKKLEAEL